MSVSWAVVAHTFNPSQGYTEKPCLEKQKNKKKKEEGTIHYFGSQFCRVHRFVGFNALVAPAALGHVAT